MLTRLDGEGHLALYPIILVCCVDVNDYNSSTRIYIFRVTPVHGGGVVKNRSELVDWCHGDVQCYIGRERRGSFVPCKNEKLVVEDRECFLFQINAFVDSQVTRGAKDKVALCVTINYRILHFSVDSLVWVAGC